MKKSLLFIATILLLSSCSTALQVSPVSPSYVSHKKANMEFIGFKNASKNHYLLGDFGAALERQGIAVNRQEYYMGVYSLQELESYRATMRYITFADITKVHSTYNDNIRDKQGLALGGWLVAGLSCFTLFPVYVPMIIAANQNYCQLDVACDCSIYVYDTEKKEIVLSIPVTFRDTQVVKGQYRHKATDQGAVTDRGRNLIHNELSIYFDKAYRYLEDLNRGQ